jgi:hypothetical protein
MRECLEIVFVLLIPVAALVGYAVGWFVGELLYPSRKD